MVPDTLRTFIFTYKGNSGKLIQRDTQKNPLRLIVLTSASLCSAWVSKVNYTSLRELSTITFMLVEEKSENMNGEQHLHPLPAKASIKSLTWASNTSRLLNSEPVG